WAVSRGAGNDDSPHADPAAAPRVCAGQGDTAGFGRAAADRGGIALSGVAAAAEGGIPAGGGGSLVHAATREDIPAHGRGPQAPGRGDVPVRADAAGDLAGDGAGHAVSWLGRRKARESELSEEIEAHLEEKVAELMEGGLSRRDASDRARREFGNVL